MAVIYEWREIRCIRRRLMGVGHVPYSGHGDCADEGACGVGDWATANAATLAVFGALTRSGLSARHVFDAKGIKAASLTKTDHADSHPRGVPHAKRDKPEHEKRRPLMVGGVCGLRPKGN